MSSVPLDAKWQPENHSCGIKHATLGLRIWPQTRVQGSKKKNPKKESEGRLMLLDLIDAKARHNWTQLLQVKTGGV